jgi:hypothetical protein
VLRPHWAGQLRHAIATAIGRVIDVLRAAGRTSTGRTHVQAVMAYADDHDGLLGGNRGYALVQVKLAHFPKEPPIMTIGGL